MLVLLRLPVRPEAELQASTQQILERRPDLLSAVLPMFVERFPTLTREEIMVIAGIPAKELRQTRAAQEWIEEGRLEGETQGEAKLTLRLLNRICGTLSEATSTRIQALPLEQLEALAEALPDFTGPADLAVWLEKHKGSKPLGRRQPPAGGERNPTQCPGRQHLKNSEGAKRGDEPGLRLFQYCFGY